ncbi:MAG: hypothetical protein KDD60_05435 [Bdellovibrionales bacterium]|nr:hypothetical protein [Bdellovibrionales bacterium]
MTEELELFQADAQKNVISESHFSLLLAKELFMVLSSEHSIISVSLQHSFRELVIDCLMNAYQFCNEGVSESEYTDLMFLDFLSEIVNRIERERVRVVTYICLKLYGGGPFDGPLFLFDTLIGRLTDFFVEKLNFPVYFLIDDGDDLPESHTIVLNSWIARRRSSAVFKVSTMFGYRTYETRSRSAIQHPHDFFQYDIGTRYLANASEDYVNLLSEICQKRLKSAGFETEMKTDASSVFFPEDEKQKHAVESLRNQMMEEYGKRFSGRAIRDNVYRHLTSEYLKQLSKGRSTGSYVYAGFNTLAILSSGHVRDFILCAQRMFDMASRGGSSVRFISPQIQNEVVRGHADDVLEDIRNPKQKRMQRVSKADWDKVYNLIVGVSYLFKEKMLSDDSERRVFSFCFQREPSDSTKGLLKLAIAEGYLMRGYISKKEGTGRRILYVLTRRLAPAFHLDVSAYSGYLSLSEERIIEIINHGAKASAGVEESCQMELFELVDDFGEKLADDSWFFISPEEAGL